MEWHSGGSEPFLWTQRNGSFAAYWNLPDGRFGAWVTHEARPSEHATHSTAREAKQWCELSLNGTS